jgi:hypothetical protein
MRNKSDLYKEEQFLIVNKLINILKLDEDNSITLYDLDNNENIKNEIMDLIPEIKKYFRFDCIHGVLNTETVKRPYLSIIRNIIKLKYLVKNSKHQKICRAKKLIINY